MTFGRLHPSLIYILLLICLHVGTRYIAHVVHTHVSHCYTTLPAVLIAYGHSYVPIYRTHVLAIVGRFTLPRGFYDLRCRALFTLPTRYAFPLTLLFDYDDARWRSPLIYLTGTTRCSRYVVRYCYAHWDLPLFVYVGAVILLRYLRCWRYGVYYVSVIYSLRYA